MPSICSGATNKETLPAPRMNEELARGRAGLKRSEQFVTSKKFTRSLLNLCDLVLALNTR